MWLSSFLILVSVLFWQVWLAGPRRALGVVVVLSLLVPTWMVLQVAGLPIHMRVATGIVGLSVYCLSPGATINWRLGIIDLIGLSLLSVHILSDWINDGLSWTVPLRAYGEWAIPFLAGRLALQSIDDVRELLPFVLVVTIILAILSAIESTTGFNLAELIFGQRPVEQFPRDASRMGLKRAFGPTMHPIYFGALQAMLFSWTLYAASRTYRGAGPKWWSYTPWIAAIGVFFTVSRAPALAIVVILYVTAILSKPVYRKILFGLAFMGIIGGVIGWQSVLYALHRWGGELKNKYAPTIIINNEQHVYSGTLTRVYLFEVYRVAMRRAGLLGFGTERTTGFPVNVPVGQQHVQTLKRLPWIDNVYILLTLRFGYLGVFAFTFMGVTAIFACGMLINRDIARGSIFYSATAGSLCAMMLLLLTVWMPHDFGFWYLWTIGAASGLYRSASTDQVPRRAGSIKPTGLLP